ncbi:MAG: 4'-phosphopantetheinyl transferase superfamily protein [Solirubrobacteraceae bacterium]
MVADEGEGIDPDETEHVFDARAAGLDERELRQRAQYPEAASAPYAARSYRYPYALVAWHDGPVGVDIERIEACDPAFAQSICTPDETVQWETLEDAHAYFSSMWSSKEALGDAVSYDPRRLQAPLLWPTGRAGAWHALQLPIAERHIAWLCWRH